LLEYVKEPFLYFTRYQNKCFFIMVILVVKNSWEGYKISFTLSKKRMNFKEIGVQLNEYETDPYFLQNFQSNTTVCFIIHVFCKSCEPEIVLAVLQIQTKTISCLQTLQKTWIIKQIVVLLWKFWRKYGSVSYLFSCNNLES
jgi:hypothetical protein